MKILVIGRFYQEAFASFVAEELEALSHQVVRYDPGPYSISLGSRLRFYVNRVAAVGQNAFRSFGQALGISVQHARLRRLLEASNPFDLALSTHDYLTYNDAQLIRTTARVPLVLWYPDPVWSFQRHMFLNAPYDILFFKDPYIVDLIRRKLNKPVCYLPECFSERSVYPVCLTDADRAVYGADLCTAGNLYAYRAAFYSNLSDRDVKIWGLPAPQWLSLGAVKPMVQNRWVAHTEKAKAFRSAKIVLNNLNPSEIWGTNVRTFEICGAGGFQITDWRPGLSQLFEIGREIVTFDDIADLRAKIDHYLAADDERREIAEAGHRRAVRDHTYAHRLRLLIDTVAEREKGYPEPRIAWREQNVR